MSKTPAPWLYYSGTHTIYGGEECVCVLKGPLNSDDRQNANAELIVRAVNSHQALVEAIVAFLAKWADHKAHDMCEELDRLTAALQVAGVEQP